MTSSSLLSMVTFLYGLAAFMYIAAWVFKKPAPGRLATWVASAGLAGNVGGMLLRWVESYRLAIGHAPLSNLYESLTFFACSIVAIYLVVERRYGNRVIGAFTTPLAFLAMAYASLSPDISDRIQPLIPALKSNWLIAHVITCFIGYGAFAIAFATSLMYIYRQRDAAGQGGVLALIYGLFTFAFGAFFIRIIIRVPWIAAALIGLTVAIGVYLLHVRRRPDDRLMALLPETAVLDELNHQLVMFGFLFLTIGIITGAVWANSAWGRYWGWDPKETWSLITWFVYATLLHARMMRGWRGKRIAYLSVVGFLAVLFTYFGVNLLPGLHSYGAMGQ